MSAGAKPSARALHGYADGRLSEAERVAVEAAFDADVARAAELARWQRQTEDLQRAFEPILYASPPLSLTVVSRRRAQDAGHALPRPSRPFQESAEAWPTHPPSLSALALALACGFALGATAVLVLVLAWPTLFLALAFFVRYP